MAWRDFIKRAFRDASGTSMRQPFRQVLRPNKPSEFGTARCYGLTI